MNVELYIYDLSKGLARQWSLPLTGTHIDAIYHTSIVLSGVEYYFGHGIQTAVPGSTHHGQPMEKVHLGETELPNDSYDLFLHNCNNFTQDLSMFLVGKSIPDHIRNLPQTFLSTPFGQMMKPQIEAALRGVTQAPSPVPPAPGAPAQTTPAPVPRSQAQPHKVRVVTNLTQLDHELASASQTCAVIFFTSATCPPCKTVYPVYDELAEEAGPKAVLIKVDISTAYDIAMKYSIRSTPTFKTYLKAQETETWTGANASQLRSNIRLLIEMAHPTHPHRHLHLPTFQRHIPPKSYILYKTTPPLPKLIQKLPPDTQNNPTLLSMTSFITHSHSPANDPNHPLPTTLPTYPSYLQGLLKTTPKESHFAILDLTRLLVLDPRIASYLAEESPTPTTLLSLLPPTDDPATTPYRTKITTLQLTCNLFSSSLSIHTLLSHPILRESTMSILTTALLDKTPTLRAAAASLAYNVAVYNHNARWEGQGDTVPEDDQVQLAASLVEAIGVEEESDEIRQRIVHVTPVHCGGIGNSVRLRRVTPPQPTIAQSRRGTCIVLCEDFRYHFALRKQFGFVTLVIVWWVFVRVSAMSYVGRPSFVLGKKIGHSDWSLDAP
ncbi:PPPDE putative peptidase domain-containing protein [Aspergillus coremiiformis]|uniref:PPPDE putative peptidase domain-containing protein n=1 Tax=Aspergillus coremiiformis TaxID=138285 RepID=A0A5N6ZGX2_9EURO|nr:PPPDE putative peptidase domain-containing protein [Aspergillus coremiiformis]